jgi:hypothetical protein
MNEQRSRGARARLQGFGSGWRLHTAIAGLVMTAASLGVAIEPAAALPPPPGPFDHFAITAPGTATAGMPFNYTVTAEDASNATVTSYSQPVKVFASDPHAVFTSEVTLSGGVGTFPMTFETAGTQTFFVTDVLNSSPSNTASVDVDPATANRLVVDLPDSTHQGDPFNVTVWAVDPFGNVDTSYSTFTGIVKITSSDARAVLPPNGTLHNGTATFPVTLDTTGMQTITATDIDPPFITGSASIEVFAVRVTGYDLAGSDGGAFAIGLPFKGSLGGIHLDSPVVGIATTPDGNGYWLASADGGVFSFGNAHFYGTLAGLELNAPIVGIAAATDGQGYYLVGADGGVFAFGSARFVGSHGALPIALNKPIVGITVTPDGGGYWLVAADGGIFAFGNAQYLGSMGDRQLNSPIVGMARTFDGLGYWLIARDGGVFAFGNAAFTNSLPGLGVKVNNVVGIAGTDDAQGYWIVEQNGTVVPLGDATSHFGSVSGPNDIVGISAGPSTVEQVSSP